MSDLTYVTCVCLSDDQTPPDAIAGAIEDHDAPEIVRVFSETGYYLGDWVHAHLMSPKEVEEGVSVHSDPDGGRWVWVAFDDRKLRERDVMIADLLQAMKWWADQEDGIPEDCWDAYAKAKKHITGTEPVTTDV